MNMLKRMWDGVAKGRLLCPENRARKLNLDADEIHRQAGLLKCHSPISLGQQILRDGEADVRQ